MHRSAGGFSDDNGINLTVLRAAGYPGDVRQPNTKMKKLSWFALVLEVSPLLAFGCLALLHPVGDPQDSQSVLIRMLDFQGTYWMRNAIPVPPPPLIAGFFVSVLLWGRHRLTSALAGTVMGIVLLALWSLIMVVPLLLHVN